MSRSVGRESLDIPKFGRDSLDMGRESLFVDFCQPCLDFRDQISVCPDFCNPCPDFRDQVLVRSDFRDLCPDFRDQFWFV